jgi:hypothetical protein
MLILMVLTGICGMACCAQPPKRQFQFEQFPVEIYRGPIKIPEDLHKDENGDWRDENDKWYPPVAVGFAGEYYLPILGCGTGCRYHLLVNLRTGAGIPDISMFDAPEQRPKTKDGRTYVTLLYYRPNSSLLIAEYHLDFDDPQHETCRQRYFVLEDGKLKPISKTFPFCTEGQEP